MRRSLAPCWAAGLFFSLAQVCFSDVTLAPLFKDGMVLQRDMKCPVWGTAAPGEQVSVEIAGQTVKAVADAKGDWHARLDPMGAGGPFAMTVAGKNIVKVSDVLVGEVWLCSGQSNMAFKVPQSVNGKDELAAADIPRIRFFVVPTHTADSPQRDTPGKWVVCSPQTAQTCTAVGYFFAREVQKKLNVPVGLIESDVGGTMAEQWTPTSVFEADSELKPLLDRAKALPPLPEGTKEHRNVPCLLYNAMIAPLVPYGIRGALWYQGEANAATAARYERLLSGMIGSWRQAWGQGDFPFGIVQLANFTGTQMTGSKGWADLRWAQLLTSQKVANVGLACAIDIGDAKDIHPKNKQEVGRRLSLWALATVYAQKVEYSGPLFESMKVEGNKARLSFTHVGAGLVAQDAEPLKGFALAGDDGKFVWAEAKIDGPSVVCSIDAVAKPVSVRYAWDSNPICNLYNKDGLPAVPFQATAGGK